MKNERKINKLRKVKKEEENNKDIKEKTEENKCEDTLQFSIKSISFIISSFFKLIQI